MAEHLLMAAFECVVNMSHVYVWPVFNTSRSLLLIILEAAWGGGEGGGTTSKPRYLNVHIWYEVGAYTRHTSWQKVTIDVIILVTWLGYNLKIRNKMRNRYPTPGSIATILISNFVRYVRATKELHPWHHHGSHVTWIKCTDRMENEDQIL